MTALLHPAVTSESVVAHRYAIYFAPALDSDWWKTGSRWLGRCAMTGSTLVQPAIPNVPAELFHALTADPRRYGWHATLKAPFALATDRTLTDLCAALHALCAAIAPFELPPLRVHRLDQFLALTPEGDTERLNALAAACVTKFHAFAAPLSQADLMRRRKASLSAEEETLLANWGYPYVLQRFRFHLSLTGSLADTSLAVQQAIQQAAEDWFHGLPACHCNGLALFAEPAPGADFVLVERIRFGR